MESFLGYLDHLRIIPFALEPNFRMLWCLPKSGKLIIQILQFEGCLYFALVLLSLSSNIVYIQLNPYCSFKVIW